MKELETKIQEKIKGEKYEEIFLNLQKEKKNLEEILEVLYSGKSYYSSQISKQTDFELDNLKELIKTIEDTIFEEINIDFLRPESKNVGELYKKFYQKVTYRNKDLSRINVFTTNNDLFNERILDHLNIDYNNGFGGGLERSFNPARFNYVFSTKIDENIEKYEPLTHMIHLYKLHGSINWIEKESNSFFNIQEIDIKHNDKKPQESTLIYPTPLKESKSLTSPYTDIIREFQKKLSLANSVLFVMGYSFSDEHLNSIIYRALASNASLSIVIFADADKSDKPIFKIEDKRIYKIYGEFEGKKIHYFEYIVKHFIPNLQTNKNDQILEEFLSQLSNQKTKDQ